MKLILQGQFRESIFRCHLLSPLLTLLNGLRLLSVVKHDLWYLGSSATMSPALSFAKNSSFCRSIAIWRTQKSRLESALWRGSLESRSSQKKQVDLEAVHWRLAHVRFGGISPTDSVTSALHFWALLSFVTLNLKLHLLCQQASCCVFSTPLPSPKTSNLTGSGKLSISTNCFKFDASVLYPAPMSPRFEHVGHCSVFLTESTCFQAHSNVIV